MSQFTTLPVPVAPSIESESVSHVTQNDATVEAEINPDGLPEGAYYQFQVVKNTSEYLPELACPERSVQLDTSDGCSSPDSGSKPTPGALPIGFIEKGSEGQSVNQSLAAAGMTLAAGTTYHYRVLAVKRVQSEDGINWQGGPPVVEGPDQTFTTPSAGTAPVIDSVSVSHLTSSDATLEAQINPEGSETEYKIWFWPSCTERVECERLPPRVVTTGHIAAGYAGHAVSANLNELTPGVPNDEYWVVATSSSGTTESSHQTFATPAEVIELLSTTTSPLFGSGQPVGPNSNSGDQPAGAGGSSSSSTPSVQSPGLQIQGTTKLEPLTSAQKLAKALKVCDKKPKKQRPGCKREAEKKYGAASKHRA